MVAISRASPFNDYPPCALPEDILAQVADLRARGHSWEAAAQAVGFAVDELRRAVRHDPNFPAALELARQEFEQEAEAECLRRLRERLSDADAKTALKAAQTLTKYLADKRHDQTRLEVERTRAETRSAREQVKAEARRAEEAEDQEPEQTPEEIEREAARRRRLERARAEEWAREKAIVYLWGGCHKMGDTPPDATDTPLRLMADHTIRGRTVYWAYTDPPPTNNPIDGPFLAPPGCRPSTYSLTEGSAIT